MTRSEMEYAPPCHHCGIAFLGVTFEAAAPNVTPTVVDATIDFHGDLVARPGEVEPPPAPGMEPVFPRRRRQPGELDVLPE